MGNSVLFTDTVQHDISGTAVETELSSFIIPANTLGVNDGLRIYGIGSLLVNGSGGEGFDGLLYIGGTKIITMGVLSIAQNASRRAYLTEYNIVNRAAKNSQIYHGQMWHGAAGSHNGQAGSTGSCVHGGGLATVDFSIPQAISLRIKHSVSDPANDYQQYAMLIEQVDASGAGGGNGYVGSDNTFRDINNTAAETVLATFTIPAGTMLAKDWLRIWSGINWLNNTGVSRTLTLKVYLGGVVIGQYTQASGSATQRHGEPLWIYIAALNSQNNQLTAVKYGGGGPNSWGTGNQGITFGDTDSSTSTSGLDMTQAQTLEIKVTHEVALATLGAQHYGTYIERLVGV